MSAIFANLIGRLGNQMFIYAYCRALAEREGVKLVTPDWVGQKIFEIDPTRKRWTGDREVGGYCQNQESLIYTRRQVREWFKPRSWILERLKLITHKRILGHRRVGDYIGYSFPVVSAESYYRALEKYGFSPDEFDFVTEESPLAHPDFAGDLAFVPDFFRMMNAGVLLRGNSTFSWWAATLGRGEVFSPVIDGLEGGREHNVEFVPGNHKKFANLDFVTDLHLKDE